MNTDDYLDRIAAIIARRGWAVQGVFPREGDPGGPFHYTVGLAAHGAGWEVLVAGLPYETGLIILNTLGDRIRDGDVPVIGTDVERVVERFPVRLSLRLDLLDHMNVATAWSRRVGRTFQPVQLWWPDPAGRFPDDPDCDPAMAAAQTTEWRYE